MKFIKSFSLILILIITSTLLFAQRGKDGSKTVSGTEIVNAFTTLTNNANIGETSITVANSSLTANFSSPLSQGDLILIYQVQGASVEDSVDNINFGNSSRFFQSWGEITNYNNAGNYEFLQVSSVPNAITINFDCALTKNYTAADRVIIVRVPRYNSLTVVNGGILTTLPWNGSVGGVLAVEVLGLTTINVGGVVDVSGLGFRGGLAYSTSVTTVNGGLRYADSNIPNLEGAEKGEGIAGDQSIYLTFNMGGAGYCRGAAANAGGGGNGHNSGGGGGANAGDLLNWNKGVGTPDRSTANYNTAWNLDTGIATITTSSGGGRGGYSILKNNRDELTVPPNSTLWGGDFRRDNGGLGGRPLDYSTGKLFFGGGGGAGEGDNGQATNGGNGGGLIFFSTYGNITGGGKIKANGGNGIDVNPGSAPIGQLRGIDAAGGAGAGGTIILKTTGTVSLTDSIVANGGRGGNQVLVAGLFATIDEGEGPGGGGGGGYIAISAGTPPLKFANGGINGVTNCPYVSLFPPNGATMGGTGLANETINSFDIVIIEDSICANTTASISASLSGNPPVGASIEWFDAQFNGNLVFTGSNFTTPILTTSTTYWVRVCPAPYLVPVLVTVVPCTFPVASFSSSDSTICINDCISFTDLSSGTPTNWSWYFFGSSTSTSSQQNPTNICYPNAGSFDVALVITNTNGQDSIFLANFITVNPLPTVVASNDTSVCLGSPATISASGGLTYAWNNGLGAGQNHTVSPIATTTYMVTGTDVNGCQNTDNVVVTVINCGNPPVASFSSSDSTICINDCISFTDLSSGTPTNWLWYFFGSSTSTSSQQNPTNICYSTSGSFDVALVVSNANGLDSIFVSNFITVNVLPNVVANTTNSSICMGDSIILTGSGATTYVWDNGVTNGTSFTPTATTSYTVIGTDLNGCQNTNNVTITVNSCAASIANFNSSNNTPCLGDCITFTDLSSENPTNWLWVFNGGTPNTSTNQNPIICYDSIGNYDVQLIVSNSFGFDTLLITNYITVDSCVQKEPVFIIPNIFSPNNDGNNDVFFVESFGLETLSMKIYNRWGEKLFESNQLDAAWDGRTESGKICSEGTYFYLISITISGKKEVYKGTLSLLR
ncbi:MAG: gliding motility-associated C-terminal domain-containing protein [Vicingaceae bacterium]|nr:gliding motility-associated C-terminal domain-containing protein [Vicingaceae bacterium]